MAIIESRQFIHTIADETLLKAFECPICLDILKPKYNTCKKCGKNFCSDCVNNIISANENAKCPLCKSIPLKDGIVNGGLDICSIIKGKCSECNLTMTRLNFYNVHLKRPCPVKCKFGCPRLISFSEQDHYDHCEYRKENCPICHKLVLSVKLPSHIVDSHVIQMANTISKQESMIDSFETRMKMELEKMEKTITDYANQMETIILENKQLRGEISLLGKHLSTLTKTEMNFSLQEVNLEKRVPLNKEVFYWNIGKSNPKLEYDRLINSVKRNGSISTHPSVISFYPIPNVNKFSVLIGIAEFPNKQNAIAIGITTKESFIPSSSKVGRRSDSYSLSCDKDLGTELYNGQYNSCQKIDLTIKEGNIIRMTLMKDDVNCVIFFISNDKQISKDASIKEFTVAKDLDSTVWIEARVRMLIIIFGSSNIKLAEKIAEMEWHMNEIYIGHINIKHPISEYYVATTLASDSKLVFLGEEF